MFFFFYRHHKDRRNPPVSKHLPEILPIIQLAKTILFHSGKKCRERGNRDVLLVEGAARHLLQTDTGKSDQPMNESTPNLLRSNGIAIVNSVVSCPP